jgi:hypothetical protein
MCMHTYIHTNIHTYREARDGIDKNLKRLETDLAAKDKEIESLRSNLSKVEADVVKVTGERDSERKRELVTAYVCMYVCMWGERQ